MNVSDIVRLAAGGPLMTVVAVGASPAGGNIAGDTQCAWYDSGGALQVQWFPSAVLRSKYSGGTDVSKKRRGRKAKKK